MKLADLKRIEPGTKLTLVESLLGPCEKARTVHKVQSNAIQMETQEGKISWLYLPKASEFRADENGFTIFEPADADHDRPREIGARYIFAS